MTDACRNTVRGVVGEAWSDEEIDDVLARLQRAKRRAQAADPLGTNDEAWEAAAREITKAEVTATLMQRRLEVYAERAKRKRRAQMAEMIEDGVGDEADALRAYDVGTEKQVRNGGDSVDAEGRARSVSLWSMVQKGLNREPGLQSRLVSNVLGRSDPAFEREVAREMARLNGAEVAATGNKDAVKAAKLFVDALEAGRHMQNAEGAWIGKITGYIGRQSHDRLRVSGGFWREMSAMKAGAGLDWKAARLQASRKAFREWRDFVRPKLHPDTYAGVELDADYALELKAAGVIDNAEDAVEPFLYRVWSDIVTGKHEVLEGMSDVGEFRPPAGKARSVSQSRVLHFDGPDAWMDYAERFGRGGLYGAVMGDLDRSGKNAALMARWGPSPEASRAAEVERLSQRARARGDTGVVAKLDSGMRKAEFEAINGAGNAPESLRLAMIGRSVRMAEVLSKLGGVVLSALSDGSFAAQRMKRAGGTYLDGYGAMLKGVSRLQGEDGKAVADALDVGARSAAAHLTSRFSTVDGPLGWASYASRLFFKVNGLEAWMDGARSGVAEMLSSIWGRQADRAWGALEIGTREDFVRYGLNEQAWELLRGGAMTLDDGRRYLTTDAVDAADADGLLDWARVGRFEPEAFKPKPYAPVERRPKVGPKGGNQKAMDAWIARDKARQKVHAAREAERRAEFDTRETARKAAVEARRTPEAVTSARNELRLRMQTLAQSAIDDALTEPRARETVGLTRGHKPGTISGEAFRTFTQFLSFSQAVIGRHLAPAMRGYAGQQPVALMAHMIVASTALGYLSLQMKQVVKGREFRGLENDDGDDLKGQLFMASLLQGGGLGLYGDFLFGEANRNGLPATLSTFAGPAVSDAEKLFAIVNKAVWGDEDERQDAGGDAVKFAVASAPGANVWYTRWLLDYLVLWRMQEAMSPGYLERYEKRAEKREGAGFLISPSETVGP